MRLLVNAVLFWLVSSAAVAQQTPRGVQHVEYGGTSGVWILANASYAGMRAQNSPSRGWRILSFIFGFPGTLLTYLIVAEGSERAYGVDIPRRRP